MSKSNIFQAVALGFPDGDRAPPSVVARGEFDVALFMVSVARKHGVPVVERPEMCGMLEEVAVGESIPERLFEAAAALLVEIGALGKPSEKVG